jgi:hypothetical protein
MRKAEVLTFRDHPNARRGAGPLQLCAGCQSVCCRAVRCEHGAAERNTAASAALAPPHPPPQAASRGGGGGRARGDQAWSRLRAVCVEGAVAVKVPPTCCCCLRQHLTCGLPRTAEWSIESLAHRRQCVELRARRHRRAPPHAHEDSRAAAEPHSPPRTHSRAARAPLHRATRTVVATSLGRRSGPPRAAGCSRVAVAARRPAPLPCRRRRPRPLSLGSGATCGAPAAPPAARRPCRTRPDTRGGPPRRRCGVAAADSRRGKPFSKQWPSAAAGA